MEGIDMRELFNYRLDTSNPEEEEEKFEIRMQKVIHIWNRLIAYFLDKGTKITLLYYEADNVNPNEGYPSTGYGIKNVILSGFQCEKEKNEDNLIKLTASLNESIKKIFIKSMVEEIESEHENITPFFCFDILYKNGQSIFSSQDYGCNTLMYLTDSDFKEFTFSEEQKHFFINLPEIIEY